jgi:FkbM family methyltransferase
MDGYIDIQMKKIYVNNDAPEELKQLHFTKHQFLSNIHSKYKLYFGSFEHEYPEQLMAVSYLTGNEKVLEIGANIGRNSLVIAHILQQTNNNNFVTLECDPNIAKQLTYNRDVNKLSFFIENSALSNRKLIQKGWDTIASDVILDGYTPVKTITWGEFNAKYNIQFDTLVLDCEGAFYYILMDMPEILTNIKLIIMENDYHDITHKKYIDNVLKNNSFYVDYSEAGGWGPCYNYFFEVWKKH